MTAEAPDRVDLVVRVYTCVQGLLPSGYRARYGAEAAAMLRQLSAAAYARAGMLGALRVLAGAAWDVVRRLPGEYFAGPYGWRAGRLMAVGRDRDGYSGRRRTGMAVLEEMRHAVRMVRRERRHATMIIVTLALATGATAAIAGIADAVLGRPLPYADGGGVHHLVTTYSGERNGVRISYQDFTDVVSGAPSLAESALYRSWSPTLSGDGEPAMETGLLVTSTLFDLLRVEPALGRLFAPAEDGHGRDDVVVLSWGLWQRRYGGARDVIGRTIDVNGSPHEVLGVGPASFADELPAIGRAAIYRPLGYADAPESELPSRGNESFGGLVRLRAGAGEAQANAEIAQVMAGIEQAYPRSNAGQSIQLEPLREASVRAVRPALRVFVIAAAVVLLIAVTNVVNLMLARATERRRDLAMRAALGAGRGRLSLLLVTESVLLALLGGVAGFGLAIMLTRVLVVRGGSAIPFAATVAMDGRVLAFTAGVCLIAGLITGLGAGLYATGGALHRVLLEAGSGRGATVGLRASRLRRSLVILQVGLCVVLVISASLLLRSLAALVRVDPGFDARVTAFKLSAPAGRYADAAQVQTFYDRVLQQIRDIPGVERVATAGATPLSGTSVCGTLFAAEDPQRFDGQDMCAAVRPVSPDYFAVMGVPLRNGRAFAAADDATAPDVGIVSESTAALLWPGQDPIGRRFATGLSTDDGFRLFEVIGVVPDVKQFRLDEQTPPQTYLPAAQWPVPARSVVLRTAVPAATLLPALRAAVWSVDDRVPLTAMGTLDNDVERTLATPKFRTLLIGSCALLALTLAIVGLYGVISGSVASRRSELAIRMSLGAQPGGVLRMVLADGTRLALAGIVIGLAGAFAGSRLLAGLLFGVSALDPIAFLTAPLIVLLTATLAILLPAVRATRVDPVESLRQ